ncbi:MAG: hypothetical protein FJX22_02695 [Alphaproteobacteria bacterium]|nr:hypothetical protein [Alphaproteobacteria bacterium]
MPIEVVNVPEAENLEGDAAGNFFSPDRIEAARAALKEQWEDSDQPSAQGSTTAAHPAPTANQAWSLGSVGAVWGSVLKVAAQAVTFSCQAIVKGLACIGISFNQAQNAKASEAANDSAASHPIDWDSAATIQEIHNLFAVEVKKRGL